MLVGVFIGTTTAQGSLVDYSAYNSTDCNAFQNVPTIQGVIHQSVAGAVVKSSAQQGLELRYNYNNGSQKGAEFKYISQNFKKDYKYIVKITAKNISSVSVFAGLRCTFNPTGNTNTCDGTETLSTGNTTFGNDDFKTVSSYNYNEYTYTTDYLQNNIYEIGFSPYSQGNIPTGYSIQSIFIKKIEIIELPPLPKFEISPTSKTVACGETSATTFSVTNVYNSPMSTYIWTYPGWTIVAGTNTSPVITLVPTNPNSSTFPGNVTVTPYVNGVAQTPKVSTVTAAPFNPSSVVQGGGTLCPGGTSNYSMSASGEFTSVVWSILPSSGAATIAGSTTSNSVTIQGNYNGTVTLTATLKNACNQSVTRPRTILVGAPTLPTNTQISGLNPYYVLNSGFYDTAIVQPTSGATDYFWYITGTSTVPSCTAKPKFTNGLSTITTPVPQVGVNWNGCQGYYVLRCTSRNFCGEAGTYTGFNVQVGGDPCPPNPYKIFVPNPVKANSDFTIVAKPEPPGPCIPGSSATNGTPVTKQSATAENYAVEIFDFMGNRVFQAKSNSANIALEKANLVKGKYILNVTDGNGTKVKEILLVE